MNVLAKTYILALEKRGVSWAGAALKGTKAVAKGIGSFAVQAPIMIGGSVAFQKVFGKDPEVTQVTVPREKYLMMKRRTLSQAIDQYRQEDTA